MEKKISNKGTQNQAGIDILISDEKYFKIKLVRTDKEDYFILIKGIICQEEITVNIQASNVDHPISLHKYHKTYKH
jgi:hypothetical protein